MRRQLLFLIFASSALLFVVNAFALKYDLYFIINWFDSISHSLGGIVLSGIGIYILGHRSSDLPQKLEVFFAVFVVGVAWEFFELYKNLTHTSDAGYFLDTAGDLFFDMLGAYFAFLFVSKKIHGRI